MKNRPYILLLFLTSFLWGMAFVFQSRAAGQIGPSYFNAIRMFLGFSVLIPFLIQSMIKHKGNRRYYRKLFKGGCLCGIFTAVPCIIQQAGMAYTTAGKAGFITSLYTLFVPLMALLVGRKVSRKTWICVISGLVGVFIMCVDKESGINKGDLLILICSLLFSVQIMTIDHYSPFIDGPDLSAMQFFFGSVFSFIIALTTETICMTDITNSMYPLLYTGIISCGLAYTLQIYGQKHVAPEKASLPLSLENAWAAIGGAIILQEYMNIREFIGCMILFAAVIISQKD